MSEPSRVSFIRVWLGLLLLAAVSTLPVLAASWLLNQLPLPTWLGFILMIITALTFCAWVMTSAWLKKHILTLSRWCGMLP